MAADTPAKGGKGGKILGMPRTTGLVVLAVGALAIGYFLISRAGGSSSSGPGSGTGGGQPQYAAGGTQIVRIIREHQGHQPKPKPKPKPKHKHKGGGD